MRLRPLRPVRPGTRIGLRRGLALPGRPRPLGGHLPGRTTRARAETLPQLRRAIPVRRGGRAVPSCGLSRRACPAALGIADTPADDPIAAARAAFAGGLFRRGLA